MISAPYFITWNSIWFWEFFSHYIINLFLSAFHSVHAIVSSVATPKPDCELLIIELPPYKVIKKIKLGWVLKNVSRSNHQKHLWGEGVPMRVLRWRQKGLNYDIGAGVQGIEFLEEGRNILTFFSYVHGS